MANWYASLEAVKKAVGIDSSDRDSVIGPHIAAASREIDRLTHRRYIPITATRSFSWSQRDTRKTYVLHLDEDLLSVSSLTKDDDDAVAIASSDYFLEPVNLGPPYSRIEIDLSSSAFFSSKNTHQRAVRVTGSWGWSEDTVTGGTVASGLASDATVTTFVCSNSALIDVGDTLLIESEQVFVSERTFATLGSVLINDGSVTASKTNTSITVDGSHGLVAGETILLESEQIFIVSIATNVLNVIRAYNGTILAAHANDTAVQTNRTLTIVRGVNGTTGATHANATAVTKYAPPDDIVRLTQALAIANYKIEQGGWTGKISSGERQTTVSQGTLDKMKEEIKKQYHRVYVGAV